jgi:uncharacterized membrane protein (DUF373 family)
MQNTHMLDNKCSQLVGYIIGILLFLVVFMLFGSIMIKAATSDQIQSGEIGGIEAFFLANLTVFVIFFALLGIVWIIYRGLG